ncbi:MAG TPA: hypothetical protein VHW64_14755 [Nocardioides sp.]|uniref:hypothetical protein n=1 Tax=Nocardioides sp. TaxID=35761 RepID=UPI002E30E5E9|nr:hypothetical protein [Nocardioides sp.]HEX3931961.1 hypothetical protein [Nocardioides sp.]
MAAPRRLLGPAGVSVLLLGCRVPSVGGRSCSLVGSVSGVQVCYRSARPHPEPRLDVRACLAGSCRTGLSLRHRLRLFTVGIGRLTTRRRWS